MRNGFYTLVTRSLALVAVAAIAVLSSLFNILPVVAANENLDATIKNLMNDPSTEVIVHNSTISAVEAAATSPTPSLSPTVMLTVDNPQQGAVVVDSSIIVSGKSPAGSLVTVHIHDADWDVNYIKHEVLQHTIGNTTSDSQGNWIFTPQHALALGKYWVQASFQDPQKGNITTAQIHFTVSNVLGKTEEVLFWKSGQFWLFMGIIGLIVFATISVLIKKRKSTFRMSSLAESIQLKLVNSKQPEGLEKKHSQFLTQEEMENLVVENAEEHREHIEELEKEVSAVKSALSSIAENVAMAGKTTELIEQELEEISDEEEKFSNESLLPSVKDKKSERKSKVKAKK